MKRWCYFVVMLALLCCPRDSHGWATEQIGPASIRRHPTTAQPGWPKGIAGILRRESRVYSLWFNGHEDFYFNADPEEIGRLISLFSETRLRDHELWIKPQQKPLRSFSGKEIDYNVHLRVLGGIALARSQQDNGPDTYEPTLTVYVDPDADEPPLQQVTLPDNIILHNEVATCPLEGKATKPRRQLWYAQVQFEDATPAADFEHGLSTKVTLWEKDAEEGISLGGVGGEGAFQAAFSDKEIASLETGHSWLTLTVGNWLTAARRDHPRLNVANLAADRTKAPPVRMAKPGFYHGRILFEDGAPPVLDPAPWPGAEIGVGFPYAGSARIETDGWFKVYFTDEQYEEVKAREDGKNIYVPSYEERGTSVARFVFPVSKLSRDPAEAGEVRIPRPGPHEDE